VRNKTLYIGQRYYFSFG